MRWWIWGLLLLNAALFGYFRLAEPIPVAPQPGHEPLNPEKLVLLTPRQLEAMPRRDAAPLAEPPPSAAPEPPAQCYVWGSFSPASLSRAQNVLQKFAVASTMHLAASDEATRYWVYVPPRKSAEEAQAKADELRALGVTEFYVVQEPQWRHAISLGVFKDEKLADALLEDLQRKGVRSAVKGMREGGQSVLHLKQVSASIAAELSRLQPDFPGSELKPEACE